MFSDRIVKIDRRSVRVSCAAFGATAIFGLLAAMAILADEVVKKAESRKLQLTTQRVALAQCFENTSGVARSSCFRELYSGDSVKLISTNIAEDRPMAQDNISTGGKSAGTNALTSVTK